MLPPYSGLLTDLYQFTMLQGYLEQCMEEVAVYEFFVHKLPPARNFLMAAGLEQALQFLETVSFSAEEVAWLEQTGRFNAKLLDYLANFRFSGDVDAMAEGTPFFPDEPILRVVAPIPVAQLVETRLINPAVKARALSASATYEPRSPATRSSPAALRPTQFPAATIRGSTGLPLTRATLATLRALESRGGLPLSDQREAAAQVYAMLKLSL